MFRNFDLTDPQNAERRPLCYGWLLDDDLNLRVWTQILRMLAKEVGD